MHPIGYDFEVRGEARGEARGIANSLLRLARRKFQEVSDEREAQVRAAPPEQLDVWMDRILDANSLDEVFEGGANGVAVTGLPTDKPPSGRKAT